MGREWRKILNKSIALAVTATMLAQSVSYAAVDKAENEKNEFKYLQAATMPDEVQKADTFCVGTTSADLREESKVPYLLKIGRGGDAKGVASVCLKMTDATASYGKDYTVTTHETDKDDNREAWNPEGNQSLLDLIESNDIDSEEYAGITDKNSMEKLWQKQAEDTAKQTEELANEKAETESDSKPADISTGVEDNGNTAKNQKKDDLDKGDYSEKGDFSSNPLAQASEKMTGIESDRKVMSGSGQTLASYLSDVGDYTTDSIPGATLALSFAEGEKEKYVEIMPVNNKESDGSRLFYITLSEPSEGMTNSAISESMFTIVDDEPEEDAKISFAKAKNTADGKEAEIVVERTGAMTETVNVQIVSEAGSAVSGVDFSPVDANLAFPFGVKKRTIKIPVSQENLTKDATFKLKLLESSGAKVGDIAETTITIKAPETNKNSANLKKSSKSKLGSSGLKGLNTNLEEIRMGNNIIHGYSGLEEEGCYGGATWSCYSGYATDGGWGFWEQTPSKSGVRVHFALSADRRWSPMYIYQGFSINWDKSSDSSSWSNASIGYLPEGGGWSDPYDSGDCPRFGTETRTYYFGGNKAVTRIRVGNWNWDPSWYAGTSQTNTNIIHWIKPIKRPFCVYMKRADSLKYTNADGSLAENQNSAQASLVNQIQGRDYAIAFDGENMVLQSNVIGGISRLSGVKIWDKEQKKSTMIASKYLNNFKVGNDKIYISLNNDFCRDYKDYIYYDGNVVAGNASCKGNIRLQPVFDYNNATIKINKTDEKMADGGVVDATVKINGKAVSYGTNLTYHIGDTLRFTSTVNGNEYDALGLDVRYVKAGNTWTSPDTWNYENGKYDEKLTSSSYNITPRFTEKNNRIVVRVTSSDVAKFEAEGMFDKSFINKAEKLNGYYDIEIADRNETQAGKTYNLAARTKAGYIPVWKETNSANYYMGTSLTYTAKNRRSANIIYLYAGTQSSSYVHLKGQLYYDNWSLKALTKNNPAGEPIIPANGGFVSAANEMAFADENGNFKTKAFHPAQKITLNNGQTVSLGDSQRPLYIRVLAGASGVEEIKDLRVSTSGSKETVSNGTTNVSSVNAGPGKIQIRANSADNGGCTLTGVYVRNKGNVVDDVMMNDEITNIIVSTTETETEKVKSVKFLIYDHWTNQVKKEIEAQKEGLNWAAMNSFEADPESGDYAEGDRVYVQITTKDSTKAVSDAKVVIGQKVNKDTGKLEDVVKELTNEEKEKLQEVVYPPVNTGYLLVKTGQYAAPTQQNIDIGNLSGMSGLPLVNNLDALLNLGPVQLSTENRYGDKGEVIGTRIRVGFDVSILAQDSLLSEGYDTKGDDGVEYGSFFHKLDNFKDSFKKAGSSIWKPSKDKVASYGAPRWGVHPTIGFFLDFSIVPKQKEEGTNTVDTKLVVAGGGLYLGCSADYRIAWYALIPVICIPCYFGVSGELRLMMDIGGTTKQGHEEEEVNLEDFSATSHNLTEELQFEFKLSLAATVQVYVGIGICGTLGVRGGMQFDAKFIWYPTLSEKYDYFDCTTGLTLTLGFRIWVDLLLFTVPIPVYTFDDWEWGLNEQLTDLREAGKDNFKDLLKPKNIPNAKTKLKGVNENDIADDLEQPEPIEYELKEKGDKPSAWNGDVDTSYMSALKKASKKFNLKKATYKETSHTMIADGYDDPDAQIVSMGNQEALLVFLQKDMTRTAQEQTAISYSVYKDGQYSAPVIIQTDATADFQPNVTEAGDDMIITWISSDPSKSKGNVNDADYQKNYVKSQEVYTVRVAKSDLEQNRTINQNAIVKLTDNNWYESKPFAVYDKTSGDYNIYWIASGEDSEGGAEAADLANPMNTNGRVYSAIVYRVYDASVGEWLVDDHLATERPSGMSEEQYRQQLLEYGGQRFVRSPLTELQMTDPLIADITGISYNGINVYAYTIDKDNDADTDADRDLFIQCYDFEKRINYVPVRITNDTIADSTPQIVRKGSETDGTTYLFYRSGDEIHYFDLTSLIKYGVDEDGQIKASVLSESTNQTESGTPDPGNVIQTEEDVYRFNIQSVRPYGAEDNQYATFSDYQVAVDDKDNIYIVY
ncbi:MAG: hypothetical protein K6G65_02955, partial [Lachnospiraceae bacterium]|nr:hypothetical protein [Lachnospiraceae bacterium]